jgi:hypothetical protein
MGRSGGIYGKGDAGLGRMALLYLLISDLRHLGGQCLRRRKNRLPPSGTRTCSPSVNRLDPGELLLSEAAKEAVWVPLRTRRLIRHPFGQLPHQPVILGRGL